MGKLPRKLSKKEARLFLWCAKSLDKSDQEALTQQLEQCHVTDEDNGGMWFDVTDSSTRLKGCIIILSYSDVDGMPVDFLIAFVSGLLSWVDRYRVDGKKLMKIVPRPCEATIHIQSDESATANAKPWCKDRR